MQMILYYVDMEQDVTRGVWLPFKERNCVPGEIVVCISIKHRIMGMCIPMLARVGHNGYCEVFPSGEKITPTHILNLPLIPKE